MEDQTRSRYFEETDQAQWSLITFLRWRHKSTNDLDKEKEHGAFKCLLQNILNNDKVDSHVQSAQEILDNWEVCVSVLLMGKKPCSFAIYDPIEFSKEGTTIL
ncbi:hypothetical protein G9A89_004291 [Geosiphon pyriformis]|nr:hypothetical protein G9A89_004291 [Geosiphon pyriformis]